VGPFVFIRARKRGREKRGIKKGKGGEVGFYVGCTEEKINLERFQR